MYFDGVHLVADSLDELHNKCKELEIPRHYFEGVKKGHPHYDIIRKKDKQVVAYNIRYGAIKQINKRELLGISKSMI